MWLLLLVVKMLPAVMLGGGTVNRDFWLNNELFPLRWLECGYVFRRPVLVAAGTKTDTQV